jgi:peptidoglycan/LPS O-acetylase OafA/YrhL
MVTFFRTPLALAGALLLLIACCLGGPVWLRVTRPLRYLGTISYGIYLWHLPVILSLKRINGLAPGTALSLTIALAIVLAAISWHFFEKPLIARYGRMPERSALSPVAS